MRALVWLRRDLRLQDNPALSAALAGGLPVEAVFIYPTEQNAALAEGAAARWYLHHSLLALQRALAAVGIPLRLLRGRAEALLPSLCAERGIERLFWNRLIDPQQEDSDRRLTELLRRAGVSCQRFEDDCLVMPEEALKDDGSVYRVFTPFWRRLNDRLHGVIPAGRLSAVPRPVATALPFSTMEVEGLGLLPPHPWHKKLQAHWQPGEAAALERLTRFVEGDLAEYERQRDLPAADRTSRLSPALHFGELSAARVYTSVDQRLTHETDDKTLTSMRRFLAEIGWREFARHVLCAFPHTRLRSMNPRFDDPAAWEPDPGDEKLRAWQRGETGIALVDAGMRQLWQSGWMHNRVRMLVASFLTKNLGIHWREGARWFEQTLVDADRASNTLGWQWVAGCGTDAAPYFRIFNPDTQAAKFDPEGAYRSCWIGERPPLPPIDDLKTSRERALARYRSIVRESPKNR